MSCSGCSTNITPLLNNFNNTFNTKFTTVKSQNPTLEPFKNNIQKPNSLTQNGKYLKFSRK